MMYKKVTRLILKKNNVILKLIKNGKMVKNNKIRFSKNIKIIKNGKIVKIEK